MMYSPRAYRPLACFSFGIVVGCGGVSASTSSPAPVAAADFPASYTQALCDVLSKCCKTSVDTTTCKASVAPPVVPQYQKYDPANGGACIAALRGFASSCVASARDYATACTTIYVGAQAIGAPCTEYADCIGYAAGDSFCSSGTSAGQTCQPTLKVGGLCRGNDPSTDSAILAQCGVGLYCATSGLCAPKVSLGQTCEQPYSTENCVAPLRCDPATMKCASLAPAGASCLGDGDCSDGLCENGTCQATISVATSRMCAGSGGNATPASTVDAGM
jgi:hypothetical protein